MPGQSFLSETGRCRLSAHAMRGLDHIFQRGFRFLPGAGFQTAVGIHPQIPHRQDGRGLIDLNDARETEIVGAEDFVHFV